MKNDLVVDDIDNIEITSRVEKLAPNKKIPPHNKNQSLEERLDRIESILCKMAHYGGGGFPSILREHGLDAYSPTRKDMSKYG